MPERRIDEQELDRFLNDLVADQADQAGYDLDGAVRETIHMARVLARAPLPAPSRARLDAAVQAETARLESGGSEEQAMSTSVVAIDRSFFAARNGRSTPVATVGVTWHRRFGQSLLAPLATAALILLTLVASLLAFGPGRPWQGAPAFIPAVETSAPRVTDGVVAELVWQSQGGPDRPFGELGQPAVDPQGNLWVPDATYGQFLIFAPDGSFLETWGTPGSGEGEFNFASPESGGFGNGDVAFDATGAFYVVDTGNHRIQKFGPDREFITAWGSKGTGAGQFRRPFSVVIDERGRVYVSDPGWGKVEVFASDGSWIATWSGLGSPFGLALDGPHGVDLDGNGTTAVWVADASAGIKKFSPEGERLATWNAYGTGEGAFLFAKSVAVDAEGRVYVVDMDADRVQIFAPDGTFLGAWGEQGSEPGQFLAPHGIALDEQGAIYVTEDIGRRVQKFQVVPPLGP